MFHSAYKNVVRLSTIANAYRATGIHPVNRHVINPNKSASVYSTEPSLSSNEASSSSLKPGPGASKLALKALEDELDGGTISLFNTRYEEGYDITSGALYTAWAKLKRATQPLADITNKMSQSSNPAPSHAETSTRSLPSCNSGKLLENVVKIPEQQQAKKTKRGTARLPKHLSGAEMVRFLEERKAQKIREAQEKEERKAVREAKKKQREEEKQQKAAKKASAKHKKQTTSSSKKKAAHTSERTVCPVCDCVYEEEGGNSPIWIECIGPV